MILLRRVFILSLFSISSSQILVAILWPHLGHPTRRWKWAQLSPSEGFGMADSITLVGSIAFVEHASDEVHAYEFLFWRLIWVVSNRRKRCQLYVQAAILMNLISMIWNHACLMLASSCIPFVLYFLFTSSGCNSSWVEFPMPNQNSSIKKCHLVNGCFHQTVPLYSYQMNEIDKTFL